MAQEFKRIAIYPLFNFQVTDALADKIRDGYEFSNKVKLRHITGEEIIQFREFYPFWGDGEYLIYRIDLRTWILEVREAFQKADRLIYEVLLAMRLHKNGLFFVKIAIHMDESKKIPYIHSTPSPLKPSLYELDVNEIEQVNELTSGIDKLDLEYNNPFRVASERFSRSFEERRDDDRIIDLAFAFEALFTDKETSKISYMGKFVGKGCSMLLGRTPKERDEINQFLIETFRLRNNIVHSNVISSTMKVNDKEYAMKDIPTQLQKYLRDSIKQLI